MRRFCIAAVVLHCLLIGCFKGICDNEAPAEHVSPDGKWKYVTFNRSCGATTASSLEISILPASAPLPNTAGNAFTGDYNHGAASYVAEVVWMDATTLQITYSSKARVFHKGTSVGPIQIKYVVK